MCTMADFEPTDKELDEMGREMDAQGGTNQKECCRGSITGLRGGRAPLARSARARHRDGRPGRQEAVEVIGWDSHLIHVKIMRALSGRDEYPNGAPFEKSAVQSELERIREGRSSLD